MAPDVASSGDFTIPVLAMVAKWVLVGIALGASVRLGEPKYGGGRFARRGLGRQGGLLAGRRAGCGAGSMRERAALVGGEIELESVRGGARACGNLALYPQLGGVAALAVAAFSTQVLSAALLAVASTHRLSVGSNSANRV